MIYGKLCIVLHAHLPWVRHPEHVEFLEEDWLFEAISETYVPLLAAFDRMREDGVRFRITMTMTPPLVEMLRDPMLIARYRARLKKLRELAAREVERRTTDPRLERSAAMHLELYEQASRVLDERCHGDLIRGFRDHMEEGSLEIVTCPATHGYLPLMSGDDVRRAQLRAAVKNYTKHFGRRPRGIWLSECAYAPGIDALLEEQGLEFFFVDSHSVLLGDPRPCYGTYAPVRTPAGPAAFARDIETGRQVWSADSGYPGDPDYREFYRDIGFDAPIEDLRGFLHADEARRSLGFKYHRVTGKVPLFQKELYDPEVAKGRARQHAEHFVHNRHHQCKHLLGLLGRVPVVTSMYDAELFGHWWFEGPWFLEQVFRRAHEGLDGIVTRHAAEILDEDRDLQTLHVNPSSWGAEGSSQVWLNGQNAWIYRHVHHAEREMVELAKAHPEARGILRRSLNQAARELLLAQSSDWAFILTTGSVVPYAIRRIREHLHRFRNLRDQIRSGRFLEARLSDWEGRDNVFPEMDYRIYV
ncbi:MAG: DUF1957 domain-containing protein [Planctomycetes bacterium]|nr:DUF1957 domain-containing protein [Planctomycetota bacterium]